MRAQFSDGNDSDFEAPELADGPQPPAAGDAVPPEDDEFLEEGAPLPLSQRTRAARMTSGTSESPMCTPD